MTLDSNIILACWLGRFDYFDAMNLQNLLHSNILNRKSNYTILFLEHNEVLTLGSTERISSNAFKDLKEIYQKKGYMVAKSSRGGQVTLHNPGQLVCYPLLNIKKYFSGIIEYVNFLEEIIIKTLNVYGIDGHRVSKRRGVWVGGLENERFNVNKNPSGEKIGAIGLKIVRNVSMHGFSLNINNDLEMYNSFTPCGRESLNVTSLGEKTKIKYDLYKVSKEIVKNMEIELNTKINFIPKSKII